MRKTSLAFCLLVLLASLFLLSVLPNVLIGYPATSRPPDDSVEPPSSDVDEQSIVMFKVSPPTPQLFWRIWSEDFYNGREWIRTSNEVELEELPVIGDTTAARVFTVEMNVTEHVTYLPLPSPQSAFGNISTEYGNALEFTVDAEQDMFMVTKNGEMSQVPLSFKATWRDIELDDGLISPDIIPEEILTKYLQLPNLPIEVRKLAEELQDSSYTPLDQVLADVQYFRTHFVYDDSYSKIEVADPRHGSSVASYIERKKGICLDAATALAIMLRLQKIPARISVGFNPGRIEDGKLVYYSTGAHSVTEVYLPPYGWVRFDATPPTSEFPLVEVSPFKRKASPGSSLLYQLAVTNRRNSDDTMKLYVENEMKWNVSAAPREIRIGGSQTADALLEVAVPEDSNVGDKNSISVTVRSAKHPETSFSVWVIIQVENTTQVSTSIALGALDDSVVRGKSLWVNGTVLTADSKLVDDFVIFIFTTKNMKADGAIIGKGYSKNGDFQIESTVKQYLDVGNYKVIVVFLGTDQYSPSTFESAVEVGATTSIEFGPEREFILGFGAIYGGLSWDNGTGFGNASILLTVTSLDAQSDILRLENKTQEDGSFRVETSFESPGEYEVQAFFSGLGAVVGSKASIIANLKQVLPEIQILGKGDAVRGEVYNITGTVGYENISAWGEPLTIFLDNQLLGTQETRKGGAYSYSVPIDPEFELGTHYVIVVLNRDNMTAVHSVGIRSRTTLTIDVTDVAGGTFLLFSASLVDDHDLPINGAEVLLSDYRLSWRTDQNGNLALLLDNIRFWPEESMLSATFAGSELYAPATIQKNIAFGSTISLPFIIPMIISASVFMTLTVSTYLMTRRQALHKIAGHLIADTMTTGKGTVNESEERPVKISLLDIKTPPFPRVWGINDQLRIEVAVDKSILTKIGRAEVEVTVDGKSLAHVSLLQQESGLFRFSHAFPTKGEHKIGVVLLTQSMWGHDRPPLETDMKLRIVDYSEETIRLYGEFLKKLGGYDIDAGDEMTAREIESLILNANVFSPEHIGVTTDCFEKTEYGSSLARRYDYERMYLSLKEAQINVE